MKASNIVLLVAAILAIALPTSVSAASQPVTDMDLDDPQYIVGTAVSTGELIGIDYSVSVDRTSPVSLDGYCMYFTVTDPDGHDETGWVCEDTIVGPGSSDSGTIETGVEADMEGTWTAEVTLYDSEKDYEFRTDSMTFEVSKTRPVVGFTVTDVVAYTATAGLSALGLALAFSSRFRGWVS